MEKPWERPPESGVARCQHAAQFKFWNMEYWSRLDTFSEPSHYPATHIVCYIGADCMELETMLEAGMNIAVVRCSENTEDVIARLREAANNYGKRLGHMYPLAIALEIRSCTAHLGELQNGEATLQPEQPFKLSADKTWQNMGNSEYIYVDYPHICEVCAVGQRIFLDNGLIALAVKEIGDREVTCTVEAGAKLRGREVVFLPGAYQNLSELSEKDINDLLFGSKQQVDFVFVSFVERGEDVLKIREALGEDGKKIMIVAKIENLQGLENMDDIIAASNAVILAREHLALDIPPEKVVIAQKNLSAACNLKGKPLACSGMVLESMVHKPIPIRAEVTDVGNAVLDGCDMIVLSQRICEGSYCKQCLQTASAICCEAECCFFTMHYLRNLTNMLKDKMDPETATALAAVRTSLKTEAAAIVVLTRSGHSAWTISQMRPRCPILAVTRSGTSARQMWSRRGIIPLYYLNQREDDTPWIKDVDIRLQFGINYGKKKGFIKQNDAVILVTGWRFGQGFTNTIRVVYATDVIG